jgi:hypothetical protein
MEDIVDRCQCLAVSSTGRTAFCLHSCLGQGVAGGRDIRRELQKHQVRSVTESPIEEQFPHSTSTFDFLCHHARKGMYLLHGCSFADIGSVALQARRRHLVAAYASASPSLRRRRGQLIIRLLTLLAALTRWVTCGNRTQLYVVSSRKPRATTLDIALLPVQVAFTSAVCANHRCRLRKAIVAGSISHLEAQSLCPLRGETSNLPQSAQSPFTWFWHLSDTQARSPARGVCSRTHDLRFDLQPS